MSTAHTDSVHYVDAQHCNFNQFNTPSSALTPTLLNSLKPARSGRFVTPCMPGTRKGVFSRIDAWLDDLHGNNVLWISGSPGVGKSTVMSSLESSLRTAGRFGASFFFDRSDAYYSDPAALWPTVAYDLARKYQLMSERLVKNLRDDKVDPGRPDIELHFKYMIQNPLSYMWDSVAAGAGGVNEELSDEEQSDDGNSAVKPPVIIIDALDECAGSDDSQSVQRNILFNTLTYWSHLHPSIKLVVTSRDERIPPSFVNVCDHIVLKTGDLVSSEENDDIKTFMERRFADDIAPRYPSLRPTWPGHSTIMRLTECAAGLFIWADTALKYIEQGIATERLDFILTGHFPEGDRLDALYRQILASSFQDMESQICQKFKEVVGAIVLAKIPLRYVDIKYFIGQRIDGPSIDFILEKLSSVLSKGTLDGCVHIGHVSFTEFVCDPVRYHETLVIPRSTHSGHMALACLVNMNRGLKFNICRLETSYRRNDKIPDLQNRINKKIPSYLLYSCRFFAEHLGDSSNSDSSNDDPLLKEIESFLYKKFLYWLEVMSLCGQVSDAVTSLHILKCWLEVSWFYP